MDTNTSLKAVPDLPGADPALAQAQNLMNHDAETVVEILLKQVEMRAEHFAGSPNSHLKDADSRKTLLLDMVLEKLHQRTS